MIKRILTCGMILMLSLSAIAGCGKENIPENTSESVSESAAESISESTYTVLGEMKVSEAAGSTLPGTITDAVYIELSDDGIMVDDAAVSAEESADVYVANDIVFYLEGQDFTYGEGTEEDEHSQTEADAHTVLHITKAGTYVLSGKLSQGQVAVDLGEDAKDNPEAVVTLVLNGIDIQCDVAPAVIFYQVYECGSADEENAVKDVDTSAAGANVIIADDSVNNVTGSYVARIYKSVELSEDGTKVVDSKKLHKYDAAFYSKMSMNVNGGEQGTGILNITAENEGLDTELHLTINSGNINIFSGNDGINTNEDNVSVTTINGGALNIQVTGATGEGDGIDSNGWLVINGGTVCAFACSSSMDSGIDADKGIYIDGGAVAATGNMMDEIAEGSQSFVIFNFNEKQTAGNEYLIKNEASEVAVGVVPQNDFTNLIVSMENIEEGTYTVWEGNNQLASSTAGVQNGMFGGFPGGRRPGGMEMPEGMQPPEGMEMPEGMQPPEGMEMPEGMQMPEGMEMPEGMQPPNGMEMPEGMQPPEGFDGKDFPGRR